MLMIPPLETVRDYGYILGDKILLRLKRCEGNRFRMPRTLDVPKELNAWFRGFKFKVRVDGENRICFPTFLKDLLDKEVWVWINISKKRMIEYLEDRQLKLDLYMIDFNPLTFKPLISKMPRYRNGLGYCAKCGLSYPIIYDRCPVHGIKLRSKPRK
ncbi:MAG: hypothetical protein QW118_06660 [Nitrososphaerota archaeon]